MNVANDQTAETISRLENYRNLIQQYTAGRPRDPRRTGEILSSESELLRAEINKETRWIRQQVIEARCFQRVTIGPPPAIGGMVANNIDPFGSMFNPPYGANLFDLIIDMVNQTIGVISSPATKVKKPKIHPQIRSNFAFTALRLAKALGTSPQLWLNLQNRYDVETAERTIGKELAKIVRVTSDAAA